MRPSHLFNLVSSGEKASARILAEIGKKVPVMENDMFLYPHIEWLRDMIHEGRIIDWAEKGMGKKLN